MAVGRYNEVAGLTGLSCKQRYGRFAGTIEVPQVSLKIFSLANATMHGSDLSDIDRKSVV